MSMKPTDSIIGPSRGTADQAKRAFRRIGVDRPDDVELAIDTVYTICRPDDMPDAAIVVASEDLETGTFSNRWWNERLNLGSLGVTGDKVQDEASPTFRTSAQAALAHVAHLLLYATGEIDRHELEPRDDPRYEAYRDAYGQKAVAPTIAGLSGRYATDAKYANKICTRAADIFGELPDQAKETKPPVSTPTTRIVFGRVPLPESLELHDIVSNGPNSAFDYLGPRLDLGTVKHRMIGTLAGTHGYFQGEARARSLTDFGIGGPWDGKLDGIAYQWIPSGLDIAPWASGPATDLEGDAIAFVQAFGPNGVNQHLRAIELSDGGDYNNPYGPVDTKRQWDTDVELTAYLFDRAEVPWDQFPFNPNVGLVTYLEHWEIGPKECPFPPVRNRVTEFQAAVRARIRMFQIGVGTVPDPIPAPTPIPVVRPYSAELDQTFLKRQWGSILRVYADGRVARDEDGKKKYWRWNPKWMPCSAWINRAKQENVFPKPSDWVSVDSPKDNGPVSMITFDNGWILLHFDDVRGWRWAGDETGKVA